SHFVVCTHDRNAVEVLQFLHGALLNEERAGFVLEQHTRPPVLPRAEQQSGIGKFNLKSQGSGRGIDGPVDRRYSARVGVDSAVSQQELNAAGTRSLARARR